MIDKKIKGFTLIELLIVVAIVAILSAVVLIAVNPARQMAQTNNARRGADVNAILNAINQYQVDNGGILPPSLAALTNDISTNLGSGDTDCDICDDLVPTYIAGMPYDPTATGANYTDCNSYNLQYQVSKNDTVDRVTVSAPNAQIDATINITR